MIIIIKLERHSFKYFHSCLTAYMNAYIKQQERVTPVHNIVVKGSYISAAALCNYVIVMHYEYRSFMFVLSINNGL